uniref:Uncharacterized protein n=1 Tax=Oryza glumipatula TaxID=40148 RepID=A0A0D9Z2W1_9ORYZ
MGTLITTSLCSFRSNSTAPRTPGMPQSFSSTTLSASIGVASGCNIGRGKGGCSSSKGVKDDELLVEDMEMAGEDELFLLNGVRVVGRASSSARQRPPWTCTSPLQQHGSTTMQALPYHTRTPLTNSRSSLSCRHRRSALWDADEMMTSRCGVRGGLLAGAFARESTRKEKRETCSCCSDSSPDDDLPSLYLSFPAHPYRSRGAMGLATARPWGLRPQHLPVAKRDLGLHRARQSPLPNIIAAVPRRLGFASAPLRCVGFLSC